MTPARRGAVDAALRESWALQREAMELGDVTALDALLADDFTLTHLTGLVQSKRQWLDDVDEDRIRYHRIDDVEIAVAAAGAAPVLVARTTTEATIRGFSGTWPLQLRTSFRPRGDAWLAVEAVATTW